MFAGAGRAPSSPLSGADGAVMVAPFPCRAKDLDGDPGQLEGSSMLRSDEGDSSLTRRSI